MNPRTKILLMSSTKKDRYHDEYDYPRSERSGTRVRRRDGTYIPVYPTMSYDEMESKFRDRRGREHYDDGRYAPMSKYGRRSIEPSLHYPMYEEEYGERPIGFRMEHDRGRDRDMDMRYPYMPRPYDPYMGMVDPYMADTPYVGDRTYSSHKEMGHAVSMDKGKLTHEEAEQWMRTIKNADGKTGAHWTKEQAQQVQQQQGIDCDPLEFWVAINMIYSDFYRVAKECNCNTIQFYSAMAEAFLDDSDARPDKLRRYYDHIVKHQ